MGKVRKHFRTWLLSLISKMRTNRKSAHSDATPAKKNSSHPRKVSTKGGVIAARNPSEKFTGPTASQIVRQKLPHEAQQIRLTVSGWEFDQWSIISKREDMLMTDWLQQCIREALTSKSAPTPRPVRDGDGQAMVFILTNCEFDAACQASALLAMPLRQWIYSTFLAAVERRAL